MSSPYFHNLSIPVPLTSISPDRNGNSPESNAKFQEIGSAYDRILKHHESPEPEFGGFAGGRGAAGFPPGFFFSGGSFFFSGGGFPGGGGGGGFGRPGGGYADDEDYDEADEDYEDYSEDEFEGEPDPRAFRPFTPNSYIY